MRNFKATVKVRKKATVADPEGKTISEALVRLGYDQVKKIRTGKVFHVELTAENLDSAKKTVDKISKDILTNPIIEIYEFEIEECEC